MLIAEDLPGGHLAASCHVMITACTRCSHVYYHVVNTTESLGHNGEEGGG